MFTRNTLALVDLHATLWTLETRCAHALKSIQSVHAMAAVLTRLIGTLINVNLAQHAAVARNTLTLGLSILRLTGSCVLTKPIHTRIIKG